MIGWRGKRSAAFWMITLAALANGCDFRLDDRPTSIDERMQASGGDQAPIRYRYIFEARGVHDKTTGRDKAVSEHFDAYTTSLATVYAKALAQLAKTCAGKTSNCYNETAIRVAPFYYGGNWVEKVEGGHTKALEAFVRFAIAIEDACSNGTSWRVYDCSASLDATLRETWPIRAYGERFLEPVEKLKAAALALPAKLADAGKRGEDREHARLVQENLAFAAVQRAAERYRDRVAERLRELETLVDDYRKLREGEKPFAEALGKIIGSLSKATIEEIPGLQLALANEVATDRARCTALAFRAARLRGEFEAAQVAFSEEIGAYRKLLEARGVKSLDHTSENVALLQRIRTYVGERQVELGLHAERVFADAQRRADALLLLKVDEQTRKAIDDSARATAAAQFLTDTNARIKLVWTSPPEVGNLPLLRGRFQAASGLLGTDALCAADKQPPWMRDGCEVLARNQARARTYLERDLPTLLKVGAAEFARRRASSDQVAALSSAVEKKDLSLAVDLHDQLAEATAAEATR